MCKTVTASAYLVGLCAPMALAHDLPGIDIESSEAEARAEKSLEALRRSGLAMPNVPAARAAMDRRFAAALLGNYRNPHSMAAALASRYPEIESVFENGRGWSPGTTLKVCFYGAGNQAAKKVVAEVAPIWSSYANVKFDFGSEPNYVACQKDDGRSIRIRLTDTGNSSLVGTEAIGMDKHNAVTMRFHADDSYRHETARFRWLVLHEFGHALGLQHEHQHPMLDCKDQLDEDKIKAKFGWDEVQLKKNLDRIQVSRVTQDDRFSVGKVGDGGATVTYSAYDPQSVMHYDLTEDLFKQLGSCYVNAVKAAPSRQDQEAVAKAYPKGNRAEVIRRQNALVERVLSETPALSPMQQKALQAFRRTQ